MQFLKISTADLTCQIPNYQIFDNAGMVIDLTISTTPFARTAVGIGQNAHKFGGVHVFALDSYFLLLVLS